MPARGDLACVQARAPRVFARLGSRLASIVRQLRTAAPDAVIVLTGAWNFIVDDLEHTDPLIRSVDATVTRSAAAGKARFAKVFPVFNPQGNSAREKGPDLHPDLHLLQG